MYKLRENGVLRLSDNAFIPDTPGNRDWQEFQEWLAEGNTPEPQFTPEELEAKQRQKAIKAAREQARQDIKTGGPPANSVAGLRDRILKMEIALGLTDPEV